MHTMRFITLVVLPPLLAGVACAQTATTRATTRATTPARPDAKAMKVLERLERAGGAHRTIRGDVTYEIQDRLTGDSETRTGWVAYRKGRGERPGAFRITFETLRQGEKGRKLADEVDYAFDGGWLVIKKHRIKQINRYQVAADPKKARPLQLGKGPLPVPFGQQARQVAGRFDLYTRPVRSKEPEGTLYIRLTPKKDTESNFTRLEMWVDRKTGLPVRIEARDKDEKRKTLEFREVRTGTPLKDELFTLPRPRGWKVNVRPLKDAAAG